MNHPQYEGEPQGYTQALDYLNIFFTGIFALEFLFKIAAFRFKVSTITRSNLEAA